MSLDVIQSILGLFAAIAVISGVLFVAGGFAYAAMRVISNR